MGRRISILLVVSMLQTTWFVISETGAKEKDLTDAKREREIRRIRSCVGKSFSRRMAARTQ